MAITINHDDDSFTPSSGTISTPGFITAQMFLGSLVGNASSAGSLEIARTINGVSFDGTSDITLSTVNTSGDQTVSGIKTFTSSLVAPFKDVVYSITDGASVDINPLNGGIQTWTLGANRSPTATNFENGQSVTLMIDDGSAYTVTWPSVTWKTNGGTAPTLNTTGYTAIQLWKVGGILYGARSGDA